MKLHLFILCTLLSLQAHSQTYDWINHFGSPGADYSNNVIMDNDGNTYSTGFYRLGGFEISGQVLPYVDNMDSYLAKFDSEGDLLWVIPFYGKGVFDRTEGIEIDDDGNVYLLTTIQEIQNIGDQITLEVDSLNNIDVLLLKFTPDGQLLWHKIYGGPSSDLGYNFLLRENDILITGHFRDSLNFDDITLVSNDELQDMFIASVDLDGNANWARGYGGAGHDRLYEIEEHENGDLAVCGYATGDWVFGSTTLEARETRFNGFTGRLSSEGEPKWAAQILTENNSHAGVSNVTTDEENNTYVTGALTGLSKIDTTVYDAEGTGQFFVMKYNNSGSIDWLHVADVNGSTNYSAGGTISYVDDRIWLGGGIGRGMKFLGKEFTDLDTTNLYIAILDKDGNLTADFHDGGAGYAACSDIDVQGETIIYSIWTRGDLELNGTSYITRENDIVVAQMDFGDVISSVEVRQLESLPNIFPNPANDILFIEAESDAFTGMHVIDALGRTIIKSPVVPQIDVSKLMPGSYFVRFIANDREVVLPLIIVR